MSKRVFIIHGWGGFPQEAWFSWLKQQLEQKGIEVHVPAMPDTEHPNQETWVPFFAEQIGTPDKDTYLVGHSIGVQTIMRYLMTIDQPIGGVVSVAGFFSLIPGCLAGPAEEKLIESWVSVPLDFNKIKINAPKITAILSDNDPYVGLDNVDLFVKNLHAETIVLNNKGHMGSNDHCEELPEILGVVEKMFNQ